MRTSFAVWSGWRSSNWDTREFHPRMRWVRVRPSPFAYVRDLRGQRQQAGFETGSVSEPRPALGAGQHRLISEQADSLADLLIAMGALDHDGGVIERVEHLASSPTLRAVGRRLGCPSRLNVSAMPMAPP